MKDDRLNLYKSLFKGREDVFAIRWEKGGKSSYMPAYGFDPHRYRLQPAYELFCNIELPGNLFHCQWREGAQTKIQPTYLPTVLRIQQSFAD